ncbi:uncharacterized protein [Taeniopygia guttata]|uniref:uncharacterized protein n=1 Tax=Taeniopygia guttata TaxID=59729 RepID=UPI003BB8B9B6
MSRDVLLFPNTAFSITSTPLSCGLPPSPFVARARQSLVRSDCSLFQHQRVHDAYPAAGVDSPVLPFGSPSVAVFAAMGSRSATKPAEGIAKTNGISGCPITVLFVSSSCCWLGPWRWSLSPQLAERRWTGALLGALLLPRCPARLPGSRSTARPQGTAPARARAAGAVRRGCPGREPGSGRAGRGLRPGTAALAGGTAGPPRWLRPLEGKRAPHKRGCPCPQPLARRARPPLPRRGQRCGPVGSSPGWPLQAWLGAIRHEMSWVSWRER